MGHSPINSNYLDQLLSIYPKVQDAKCLSLGFKSGFSLNFNGPRKRLEFRNMISAFQYTSQVQEKIDKEVQLGRILGPFSDPPMFNLRCNPIGLVPKKQGGWRMITNLSYPTGNSVNDFIDPNICSVNYATFDDAISLIAKKGEGALLAKMDISNAFRLLPVCPQDFCLLGLKHADLYYIDKCLPMGCSLSCSLFEKFSTFLHWELSRRSELESIIHYLDDFLFVGSDNSLECKDLMTHFEVLCLELGIPLALEKTEGPVTCLSFLGLGIDTISMTIFVPGDKVTELLGKIHVILESKKVTLREMQSLAGSLAFVVKALPAGRAFCSRIYGSFVGVRKPHHFVRITKGIKLDLLMWVQFLSEFNGRTQFPNLVWQEDEALHFYSDSSGSQGCGVVFGKHWCCVQWPHSWPEEIYRDITLLELIPIVLGVIIWAEKLKDKKLLLHIDNLSLVHIINRKSSTTNRIMTLVRMLVLQTLRFNIQIRAQHIQGVKNEIADAISRFQWSRFRQLAPWADPHPSLVPIQFWKLLLEL